MPVQTQDAPPARRPRRLVVETDGGSRGNPGPAGYGAVVRDESGVVLAERADYLGVTTNNVAEYSGLVAGLRAARAIDPEAQVEVRADSKLLVEQMSGRWQIKHDDMRRLAAEARAAFPPRQVRYTWIPRAQNTAADALANTAMDTRAAVRRDGASTAAASGREPVAGERVAPTAGAPSASDAAAPARAAATTRAPLSTALGAAPHVSDGPPVTVVLVRHGQTDDTAARSYAGGDTPGAPLNARGRTEAALAADLVARIGRDAWPDLPVPSVVLASSMLRAQQTAAAIGRRLGVRPEVDDDFAECRFGAWDRLTAVEIEDRWPGRLGEWLTGADVTPPGGGESMPQVAARVGRALARLRETHAGRTVVVATHTIAVRTGAGSLAGVPPRGWHSLRVPPGSATIVRLWPDDHELTVLGCPSDL